MPTHLRFSEDGTPVPATEESREPSEPSEPPEPSEPSERDEQVLPWKGIFTKRGKVRPPFNPSLEAFWFKRRELFSKFDRGVRLDAESWYSVTPELLAAHMAARLIRGAARPGRANGGVFVVDPFCGCGGNAIQQALHDPAGAVLAIDIDPWKVEMARHNAYLYGVRDRIQFIVGDAMVLLPRLRADAVLLSPPWGGVDYDDDGAHGGGAFDLDRDMLPCSGLRIFDAACATAPAVAYYLPRRTDRAQIAELARRHPSQSCELQHVVRRSASANPKLANKPPKPKALIAFFDALAPLGVPPGVCEVVVDDPSGPSPKDG